MKIKRVFILVSAVALLMIFCIASYAAVYNHIFDDYSGSYSIASAKSPARQSGDSTQEKYVGVISKKNQPRATGTNPHIGTDFLMSVGENVYPIMDGVVFSINHDLNNNQLGSVIVKSTINNQDYYVKYLHIVPNNQLAVNQQVKWDNTYVTE